MMPERDPLPFDPSFAGAVDWANMYRALGVQVVPTMIPGEQKPGESWKRPVVPWRGPEFQGALVPPLTWDRWYGEQGQYVRRLQFGMITGQASGHVVMVDLDDHKTDACKYWWLHLLHTHNGGDEPHTWQQITGGGGRHLFFRTPVNWRAPTNRTPLGVDVRGQGGFAVLPPSMHDSGRRYVWKVGCEPWNPDLADGPAMAPAWLLEAIDRLVAEHGGGTPSRVSAPAAGQDHDAFGNLVDGREDAMFRYVWGCVVNMWRECPFAPGPNESKTLAEGAYERWERGVKSRLTGIEKREALEAEGRGPTEFWRKWQRAMDQWDTKVAEDGERPLGGRPANQGDSRMENPTKPGVSWETTFPYLNLAGIRAMQDPKYLIHGLAPEKSLGFIFGPPASFKSLIALSQALSIATGRAQWWGRAIERHGAVAYISSEGASGIKNRLAAWEAKNGGAGDAPFYLMHQTLNFMAADDVSKLLATVEAMQTEASQPMVAVYVDTVSRVLPGADENLQKDMTLFIGACDAVRERFGAMVTGVHHTSRAGNLRGSTVFDGAADFLLQIERDDDGTAKTGVMHARKIKDAEDGWNEAFEAEKIELPFGKSSFVAVKRESVAHQHRSDGWPDKVACQVILDAIKAAWEGGEPWSNFPQSRKVGKYAPLIMAQDYGVTAKTASEMIEKWLMNKVLTVGVRDSHRNVRGLKVIGWIG
jgi:hypothetical protein